MDRDWSVSIFVKYVLIFFLPIYLVIGPFSSYTSILIHTGIGGGPFGNYDNSVYMLAPFLALIFTLPAALFDYAAYHRPEGRSIGKLLVLVFILLNPLVQIFLVILVLSPTTMIPQMGYGLYNIMSQSAQYAVMADSWSLPLMVVVPFFVRQVRSLKTEEKAFESQVRQRFAGGFSKYDVFATLLGLSIFVVPILISNSSSFFNGIYAPNAVSLLLVSGGGGLQIGSLGSNSVLTFTTMTFVASFLIPVLVLPYMLFIHDVFEYLKSKTSQQRCLVTGLLAFFVAPLMLYVFVPSWYAPTPLYVPLPIVLLMAIVIIWRVQPIDAGEESWEGPLQKPSYKRREPIPSDGGGDEAEAPASHPASQEPTGGRKQKQQYDWNHRGEDVFGGESDNDTTK